MSPVASDPTQLAASAFRAPVAGLCASELVSEFQVERDSLIVGEHQNMIINIAGTILGSRKSLQWRQKCPVQMELELTE